MKSSIEAGRTSVKLWIAAKLIELTIFGLAVTGFVYLIAKVWGY